MASHSGERKKTLPFAAAAAAATVAPQKKTKHVQVKIKEVFSLCNSRPQMQRSEIDSNQLRTKQFEMT